MARSAKKTDRAEARRQYRAAVAESEALAAAEEADADGGHRAAGRQVRQPVVESAVAAESDILLR